MAEEAEKLPQLECELRDLDAEKTPKTVGDLYELKCSGILETALSDETKIEFQQDGMNYALHIVNILKSEPTEFVAEVTSYLPSVYNNQSFLLADGETKYEVQGLSWSYDSVLAEAEQHQKETLEPPPEKLEPYPYYGPIGMSYPYWVWGVLLGFILVLGFFVFRWQRKRLQKKRLIEAVLTGIGSKASLGANFEGVSTALTPYQEFNKSLRRVIRATGAKNLNTKDVMTDLDRSFRVYLTRALTVPAFDWSESEIISDIRKYHRPVYQENGRLILRLLRELDRAKGHELKKQDVEQLSELSRKTVEGIDRFRKGTSKPKGLLK